MVPLSEESICLKGCGVIPKNLCFFASLLLCVKIDSLTSTRSTRFCTFYTAENSVYSVYSVVLLICCAERSGDFDDGLGDARPAWFANQDAGISYHAIAVCRLVRFKVGLERLLKGGLLVLELFDFENYFDQCGALFFDLGFCELHVFVPFGLVVVVGWWTGARMRLH